jgi:hypothetical protein
MSLKLMNFLTSFYYLKIITMINIDYKYSKSYNNVDDFIPEPNSKYIYGYSTESRSLAVNSLLSKSISNVDFVRITLIEDVADSIVINEDYEYPINLRNSTDIKILLINDFKSIIYIDSSGLSNRITAALLNNAMKLVNEDKYEIDIRVLYLEPELYKIKQFKAEGVFNDLSEKIDGLKPLPGFANLIPDDIDFKFIALLGFEGGRFAYLIDSIEPAHDNIIPIIGVPGYRMEYPFVAYWGNRRPLKTTKSYENVKFATANSLAEIYVLLTRIYNKNSNKKIKLAPIGTKPHAIGAMLFAIKHPNDVELVYDNPKRKSIRTEGTGLLIECCVSKLFKEI